GFAALLEGEMVAARVDDFLEQAGAEAAEVNAQTLGLREKKPCDSGRNGRRVLASRRCLSERGPRVVRGRGAESVHRNRGSVAAPGGWVARPGAARHGGAIRCPRPG